MEGFASTEFVPLPKSHSYWLAFEEELVIEIVSGTQPLLVESWKPATGDAFWPNVIEGIAQI